MIKSLMDKEELPTADCISVQYWNFWGACLLKDIENRPNELYLGKAQFFVCTAYKQGPNGHLRCKTAPWQMPEIIQPYGHAMQFFSKELFLYTIHILRTRKGALCLVQPTHNFPALVFQAEHHAWDDTF